MCTHANSLLSNQIARFHPFGRFIFCRQADKDMLIKGYRIPKGTPLMLAPHPMHVSPHNFLHPNKFWPERWVSSTVPDFDPKSSGSCLAKTFQSNLKSTSALLISVSCLLQPRPNVCYFVFCIGTCICDGAASTVAVSTTHMSSKVTLNPMSDPVLP